MIKLYTNLIKVKMRRKYHARALQVVIYDFVAAYDRLKHSRFGRTTVPYDVFSGYWLELKELTNDQTLS